MELATATRGTSKSSTNQPSTTARGSLDSNSLQSAFDGGLEDFTNCLKTLPLSKRQRLLEMLETHTI